MRSTSIRVWLGLSVTAVLLAVVSIGVFWQFNRNRSPSLVTRADAFAIGRPTLDIGDIGVDEIAPFSYEIENPFDDPELFSATVVSSEPNNVTNGKVRVLQLTVTMDMSIWNKRVVELSTKITKSNGLIVDEIGNELEYFTLHIAK